MLTVPSKTNQKLVILTNIYENKKYLNNEKKLTAPIPD